MKLKLIENETILLPEIIAEGAFWDALAKTNIKEEPERDYNLQLSIVPKLVERAQFHFNNNTFFNKRVKAKGDNGRNFLWVMMEHWTYSLLNKQGLKFKRLY